MTTSSTTSAHILRQLKYLLPGLFSLWWFDTLSKGRELLTSPNAIPRNTALCGLVLGVTTILLFLYVMFLPFLKGIQPDYTSWRNAGELSVVIPILTSTIVVGWLLGSVALGSWSSLGYLESTLAVTGLYALALGILGLFPVPKAKRS